VGEKVIKCAKFLIIYMSICNMWTSCGPYKSLLPILPNFIGATLWNFKVPKELACGYMGPYQSFKLPNVI
jgi:hypothetical protein